MVAKSPKIMPTRPYLGVYLVTNDNMKLHTAHLVDAFLESEDIRWMDWAVRFPNPDPIENAWAALGR
ncbi:hypothetical protein TNCV_4938121 [Trichonephila clavipes]|nr:hypothetical protein TNCV_4938121 [Trichonephila clavipes]